MRKLLVVLLAVGFLTASVGTASAAVDFQAELKKLAQDNAVGYMNPFATAFGTDMNSGLYHTAKPHAFLGFDVSVKMSGAMIPTEDQFYTFMVPTMLDLPMNMLQPGSTDTLMLNGNGIYPDRKAATVFGPNESYNIAPTGAAAELNGALLAKGWTQAQIDVLKTQPEWNQALASIPTIATVPGTGLDIAPLALPQVSLGLIFGTEVMVRYLPEVELENFGKLKFWGFGVKHSISQWIPIPLLGIDITGQYVKQQLKIGTIIESNHSAMNLEVSRRFSLLIINFTPYAGFQQESSDLKVDYVVTGSNNPALEGQHVGFKMDGKNTGRMTVGARLGLLGIFTVNADYSMGKYKSYSAGVGLTLR